MLIVLTSEQKVKNESLWLNKMFDQGLDLLHIRKPDFTPKAYRNLLLEIKPCYHQKVMIHEYHELSFEYNLRGIHIPEYSRKEMDTKYQEYVHHFHQKDFWVSSSFHNPDAITESDVHLDYYLLSPVFTSISKLNYKGNKFNVNHIRESIIALGGIHENNISEALHLGYSGIAILGSIWNAPDPLENYMVIKNKYQSILE